MSAEDKRIRDVSALWATESARLESEGLPGGGLEFSARVLCFGHWPQMERFGKTQLPPEMHAASD